MKSLRFIRRFSDVASSGAGEVAKEVESFVTTKKFTTVSNWALAGVLAAVGGGFALLYRTEDKLGKDIIRVEKSIHRLEDRLGSEMIADRQIAAADRRAMNEKMDKLLEMLNKN
ncbi:hypothetical protein Ndes2526B_g08085 [Nannochloris sp. 'desiccata']|nr:hypothetical protein KSW81_002722 [Chlorella desiccata (nom. nud.)]